MVTPIRNELRTDITLLCGVKVKVQRTTDWEFDNERMFHLSLNALASAVVRLDNYWRCLEGLMVMTIESDLVMTNGFTTVIFYQPWDVVGSYGLVRRLGIEEELRNR